MNLYLMNMPAKKGKNNSLSETRLNFHALCFETFETPYMSPYFNENFFHPSEYKMFLYSHFPKREYTELKELIEN